MTCWFDIKFVNRRYPLNECISIYRYISLEFNKGHIVFQTGMLPTICFWRLSASPHRFWRYPLKMRTDALRWTRRQTVAIRRFRIAKSHPTPRRQMNKSNSLLISHCFTDTNLPRSSILDVTGVLRSKLGNTSKLGQVDKRWLIKE